MKLPVIYSAEAKEDIIELGFFLTEKSSYIGAKFQKCVVETGRRIAKMPEIKSIYPFRNPEMQNVRIWPVKGFTNYLIFYRIEDNYIEIVRLLHGATNYAAIFDADADSDTDQ